MDHRRFAQNIQYRFFKHERGAEEHWPSATRSWTVQVRRQREGVGVQTNQKWLARRAGGVGGLRAGPVAREKENILLTQDRQTTGFL